MANTCTKTLLRGLPQVEEVLHASQICSLEALLPRTILADCARSAVDAYRSGILDGSIVSPADTRDIADAACAQALATLRPSLRRVINATGVIVHTNLGRSPLSEVAVDAVVNAARGYSTLEYNTNTLSRGSRHDHVEGLLCTLTGAEAAIAVNNNAAAVVMVLTEFAQNHEAIVSRGELVEIGGSFRIPDIMAFSHADMVEVGATNKTHESDYERALTPRTAMLLKVHPSNYRVVGFSESVDIPGLRRIADRENERRRTPGITEDQAASPEFTNEVLVYEDQGSGAFVNLACFGEFAEATVAESLQAGCDLVSFSGDKLLGGPQAGIVVGSKQLIDRLKKNPLARAMRLDKMTLAALEATLRLYLNPDEALISIPTLRMLSESEHSVRQRAEQLANTLRKALPPSSALVEVVSETARAGGGALPLCDIPTFAVSISLTQGSAQDCETFLVSKRAVPVIARIKKEMLLLDARTIEQSDIPEIRDALHAYFETLCAPSDASSKR